MDESIVLCVDDDTTVLNALRTLLGKQLGAGHVVEIAESGAEALELCAELRAQGRELSVVISDFIMPGMRGDEFLVRLHKVSEATIKILLTGQSDLGGVKRTINEANLYRFLEKPFNNADILLTTQTAIHAYRQDLELKRQNEELKQINLHLEALVVARTRELEEKNVELGRLAVTDRLTGLCNRLKLDHVLEQELARSHRYSTTFAILLLDVDKFKSVNDEYGHQIGDMVLVEIAAVMRAKTREVDVLGRWGGEEFLVICCDTNLDGAKAMAENLRDAIASHIFPTLGHKTASFGISTFKQEDTLTSILERADRALYRAKESGRNRVECEQEIAPSFEVMQDRASK